ncbi:MAG TPA: BON domain-containing protein [Rhodocyclaceae bacterium]|nr:BON domain-containing protein [Rhodocyclaceae bacterium]
MNTTYICKSSIRSALIAAGLVVGIGAGTSVAIAADEPAPQAHSDGLAATISDTAITAKVKAKLMGESVLKKSDISVTTTNGVVTLNGTATSSNAKSLAESEAMAVDGVKSVDNDLSTPSSNEASAKTKNAVAKTKRVVSDSWITTKVKSEILADSVSKGFDVGVKTTHGVVALKGTLANSDAVDHVKDIAEKVDGVKSVDTSALKVASK